MASTLLSTTCCIVGGGPAGMMLGLLLAKAGVDVIVLEKHEDFFRDFRGDTIHPSTVDVIDQLGLRGRFDAIPQTRVASFDVVVGGTRLRPVDFRTLRGVNRRLVLMPQWDFLALLAEEAGTLAHFRLIMSTEATGLLREGDRVTGVFASSAGGRVEIRAPLTVAADGRSSAVRAASGLPAREYGVPIDVLWFRMPKPEANPPDTLAYVTSDAMVVTIPREGYYQCGMLIPKNGFDEIRRRGIDQFRSSIVGAAEFLEPVVDSLADWDQVKLLSVQINRLDRWYLPGFLCIGDAAHAMSPAFGVGINFAIQDAVAAANLLVTPLLTGAVSEQDLARLQKRRFGTVRAMQRLQVRAHRMIGAPNQDSPIPVRLPRGALKLVRLLLPVVRRFSARLIGRGLRPEQVRAEILNAGTR